MDIKEFETKLTAVLDRRFPKYQCKERGQALVLVAETIILVRELFNQQKGKIKDY